MTAPIPTDFWGIVVPTWLGAAGSIAASAIAVIAYVNSRSAKSGVQELGDSLNRVPTINTTATGTLHIGGTATATTQPRVVWAFEHNDNVGTFRNESGALMTVTDISGSRGVDLTLRYELPLSVPPTAMFRVNVHRILGGPAVTGITLEWANGDGTASSERFSQTFFV